MAINEQSESTVQTLSFYTIGSEFTRLIRDFIKEGSFHTAYAILEDGGLEQKHIQAFFLHKLGFEGDTREGDGTLEVVETNGLPQKELEDMIFWGLHNAIESAKRYDWTDLKRLYREFQSEAHDIDVTLDIHKNLYAFSKVFDLATVRALIGHRILTEYGYEVNPDLTGVRPFEFTGVVLPSGTVVRCDHQDHNNLYEVLSGLGYANSRQWTEDTKVIHISSGQLSGNVAYGIKYPKLESTSTPTESQIQACFDNRRTFDGIYGESKGSMTKVLMHYVEDTVDFGGKFNNLTFLDRFYSFNLPKFSKEPFEGACIRTSPKYSMAGLLNSKFNVTNYEEAVKEIEADFEKYKKVVGYYKSYDGKEVIGNKLHIFYQEFLEGANGVCHHYPKHMDVPHHFTYSVSDNQGDIVQGVKSNKSLSLIEERKLEDIARTLCEDLNEAVQIEFVAKDDTIYIVQLRVLENNPTGSGVVRSEDDIKYKGKSFSAGYVEADIADVLVVDSDCDSEKLIGKKALIVREDVEFSHVLALSKSLKIPSIYAVGNVELGDTVKLDTNKVKGCILK